MATNLAIDDRLIDEARAVGGHRAKKEAETAEDVVAETADHERAATFFKTCRAVGISPGAIDVLTCAIAVRHGLEIFTIDADFARYATVLRVTSVAPDA